MGLNRAITAVGLACLLLAPGCFKLAKPAEIAAELPAAGAFPHELFGEAIAGRVTEDGLIDYKAIQADRGKLDAYLGYIAKTSPASNPELFPTRDDQLAYYINAYNALAIRGVIDRPGLKSVNDIKVEYFYFTRYKIGGKKLDLYRLENQVIRPGFDEPRAHFALNCQSAGCPFFPPVPFPARDLDAFLDAETLRFVMSPEKVRLRDDGVAEISQIFEWYASDFASSGGAIAFIRRYRDDIPADAKVEYIPYDWALIAQEGRGP